jgi:hypothetical protein
MYLFFKFAEDASVKTGFANRSIAVVTVIALFVDKPTFVIPDIYAL